MNIRVGTTGEKPMLNRYFALTVFIGVFNQKSGDCEHECLGEL